MKLTSREPKIDSQATLGLTGTNNSLAYRVHEIETHIHGMEKWFGIAAVPNAEIHTSDKMDGTTQPFILTSGNNDFGSWVQILGSGDTPVTTNMKKFDVHRCMITSTNSTSPFIIHIVSGESADIATKLTNEEFTEVPFVSATNSNDSGISDIMSKRVNIGEKLWARCACVGQNGSTLSLYIGLHEYIG